MDTATGSRHELRCFLPFFELRDPLRAEEWQKTPRVRATASKTAYTNFVGSCVPGSLRGRWADMVCGRQVSYSYDATGRLVNGLV